MGLVIGIWIAESASRIPNPLSYRREMDHIPAMENLSPHRKFRGPALQKPAFKPFYEHKWPEDLPSKCHTCGIKFRAGWNLLIGPNRLGRILRQAAKISFLPCFIALIAIPSILDHFFPALIIDERLTTWFILTMIFLPPVMFFVSLFMPITRRVECLKCDWSHDYPSLKASLKKREQEANSET